MTRLAARRACGDAGDTLLEILMALVIIALAVGPILGTLIESAASSAEHRGLAAADTLLKSFAETATSRLELATGTPATASFTECATTYKLISKPSSMRAHAGSAVTVFVTGFPTGPLRTFHVTVGGIAAKTPATTPIAAGQSQPQSTRGNMQVTFLVPTGLPLTTPQAIRVSDGAVSVVSSKRSGITVTSSTRTITKSPYSRFRLGIASISYWHSGTGAFQSTCKTTTTPTVPGSLRDGVQLVTLRATAGDRVSDTLQFVLRNPKFSPPPKPTPTMTVVGQDTTLPRSGTHTLTFVATVSVATTPAPAGTISWSITGPRGAVSCVPPPTQTSTPTSLTSTCKVPVGSTPLNVGRYTATASIPANASYTGARGSAIATVYASAGSGTMSVSPKTVIASSTGNALTFTYTAAAGGTFDGQVDVNVTGAAGWTHPQTTNTALPGYVSATGGSGRNVVSVSGTTVDVTGVTLSAGQTLKISYRDVQAPATTGPYAFVTSEASISSGTPAGALASSPVVKVVYTVTSASATNSNTVSASLTMPVGTSYAILAFSSQSGPGDSAMITGTGFTSSPVFKAVGTQQNFGTTAGDHAWAWSTTGTGGTGSVNVTFTRTGLQIYLEIVRLSGSTSPPVVTSTAGFHNASAVGTAVTASLSVAPSKATDPELIFVATQGDLGSSAPVVSNAVNLAFAHGTHGSVALYTGKVRQSQLITIQPNWWSAMALEING